MHLIDGYGQGSAVYSRLHHAMADGMALTQVLLSLTDEVAGARRRPCTRRGARSRPAARRWPISSGAHGDGAARRATPAHDRPTSAMP